MYVNASKYHALTFISLNGTPDFTVIVFEALTAVPSLEVAFIVTVPTPFPGTTPVEETVAI